MRSSPRQRAIPLNRSLVSVVLTAWESLYSFSLSMGSKIRSSRDGTVKRSIACYCWRFAIPVGLNQAAGR